MLRICNNPIPSPVTPLGLANGFRLKPPGQKGLPPKLTVIQGGIPSKERLNRLDASLAELNSSFESPSYLKKFVDDWGVRECNQGSLIQNPEAQFSEACADLVERLVGWMEGPLGEESWGQLALSLIR